MIQNFEEFVNESKWPDEYLSTSWWKDECNKINGISLLWMEKSSKLLHYQFLVAFNSKMAVF